MRMQSGRNCTTLSGRLLPHLRYHPIVRHRYKPIILTLSSADKLVLISPGPAFSGAPPLSATTPPHPKIRLCSSRRPFCCCSGLNGFYFACHFTALLLSSLIFHLFILSVLLLYEQSLNCWQVRMVSAVKAKLDKKDKFTLKDNRRQSP